ncbi:MAG TPA: MGMT family protein [Gammaproteobacteria bacterium]|jgi:methylated-DNA-protein-cysteine methyltransferase-like protein
MSRSSPDPRDTLYKRIYAAVRRIPEGRVSTYGRIAKLAKAPGPRVVGYAMAALTAGSAVPWQRVVNHKGEVSARSGGIGSGETRQRRALEEEGVYFDLKGRIDLKKYGWPKAKSIAK